jgi:hypothetical protein
MLAASWSMSFVVASGGRRHWTKSTVTTKRYGNVTVPRAVPVVRLDACPLFPVGVDALALEFPRAEGQHAGA